MHVLGHNWAPWGKCVYARDELPFHLIEITAPVSCGWDEVRQQEEHPPTDTGPCGAPPPVRPGCDSEGNQPAGPLAPGGASPSSDPGIEADLGSGSSGGRGGRRSSQDLSSPGSDYEDVGGARLGRMISSISETELERSSDDGSSSSGRSSHLTNSIEEASSPASEPEPVQILSCGMCDLVP